MENAERVAEEPRSSSLFPLPFQPISDPNPSTNLTNNSVPQWLCNPSFTADLSVVNDAKSSQHSRILLESEEEDEEEEGMEDANAQRRPESRPSSSYELLPESASDEERDRKKKRKRKRKKISSDEVAASVFDHDSSLRKPDVRYWVTPSSDFKPAKDYYFDSRGDRNNLAFGCLYRMDVARYKLRNSTCSANLNHLALYRWNMRSSIFDGDMDAEALDRKVKANGRYWSAKYTALERHKNFKRMRIIGPPRRSPTFIDGDFIPLLDDKASGEVVDGGSISRTSVVEESWEDEMLRKTREFNKMTREHPHDEKVWLDFAKFQDRVASTQPQKGARLQTLEKKISILEKATELNPDNEELLLCLLNSYQSRDSTDVFIGRWEKILMQHSGSYKLWNEFLRVIQGEFSRFKVSEMRKMYANAIQALSSACSKQYRQVHQTANAPALDPATVQQELGLVDIFLSLCRFEWQAGYQELATALFQAEIEYSLFCPSLLLTEQSKRRLFEHFWNSNGARIGEDGALGWSSWLEKEEEQRQKIINEESNKNDGGGWTGWSLPLSKSEETSGSPENMVYNDVAAEEFAEESERDIEQKDDTEALLKMLGIDADAEADSEVKDPATWTRWAEVELSRDSDQWMPVHARSDGNSHGDGMENREGDEHLLRVVLFEDVSEYLFSISSEEARLSLVSQFIDFFGGRISQRICTNSSTWAEKTHCLEVLPDSILDDLRRVRDVSMKADSNQNVCMESLLNSSTDISMRTDMMKFLRNAALLCITAFPCNYILEEAALVTEELLNTRMNSSSSSVTPCRALAKSLLKNNRQDVLLCGVYAQREAVFGNVDHARKIFDMALASIEGLPLDLRSNAFLLYFWYAEMERDNSSGSSSESLSRAIHILSCFGGGVKYSPFKCQPSSLQLLKAHQGFKEQIRMLRTKFARGIIDDISIALICSAALFEELTTGWIAGIEILDQALSFVLPERRNQSYELEFLAHYHVSMLWRHREELKLSKVWDSVIKGLQIYPFCPKFYSELVEISHLHTSPNKLRWIFDDYCHKKPSVIVWLFALSFEISRRGSQHRIRGLFERAFSDDRLRNSVVLWRCYIAYEINVACNPFAARRIMFRAVHACPWSKKLWLDGFVKLNSVLTAKELSDLQEVMRDKELNLRTDIYEILLQDEVGS